MVRALALLLLLTHSPIVLEIATTACSARKNFSMQHDLHLVTPIVTAHAYAIETADT